MKYYSYLKSFPVSRTISITMVVCIALIFDHLYSMSHEGWIVLSALLVVQTTRGTPLLQSMSHFFLITLAISVSVLLQYYILNNNLLFFIAMLGFVAVTTIVSNDNPITNRSAYLLLLFPIVFLLAIAIPKHSNVMYVRLVDVFSGSIIGILCNQIIFPVKLELEFRNGLVPLLNLLIEYSRELIACFKEDKVRDKLNEKRIQIEYALQSEESIYPEWVYEFGFNPGLRGGFRFFLVNIERITEIYFSLDYLMRSGLDVGVIQELSTNIEVCMNKNIELLNVLIEYFVNKKITATQSDYITDISELEVKLRQNLPGSIELIDISPEYVKLAAFVRDIKDLREMLLQLVLGLPA